MTKRSGKFLPVSFVLCSEFQNEKNTLFANPRAAKNRCGNRSTSLIGSRLQRYERCKFERQSSEQPMTTTDHHQCTSINRVLHGPFSVRAYDNRESCASARANCQEFCTRLWDPYHARKTLVNLTLISDTDAP